MIKDSRNRGKAQRLSTISDAELINRIRLLRSENVGPVTYRQLLARFQTAKEALAALPDLARKGGKRGKFVIGSRDAACKEIEACQRAGVQILFEDDPLYPPLLRHIPDAPAMLCSRGNAKLAQSEHIVAVAGARNASAAGMALARELAAELGAKGWIIISGLARGIDMAAHKASVKTGTICVLAGGIDRAYPREAKKLFDEIIERGLALSEMALGMEPFARLFPRRNRIIAGISRGVIIVEAADSSGSLITARHARDYGREVMATPGSPIDPRSSGGNALIRDGAPMITCAADVILTLDPLARKLSQRKPLNDTVAYASNPISDEIIDAARAQVHQQLSATPTQIDEIVRQAEVSAGVTQIILLELEIAGQLVREHGGYVVLVNPKAFMFGVSKT